MLVSCASSSDRRPTDLAGLWLDFFGTVEFVSCLRIAVDVLLRLVPHVSLRLARTFGPGVRADLLDRLIDDLRKAEVPE